MSLKGLSQSILLVNGRAFTVANMRPLTRSLPEADFNLQTATYLQASVDLGTL